MIWMAQRKTTLVIFIGYHFQILVVVNGIYPYTNYHEIMHFDFHIYLKNLHKYLEKNYKLMKHFQNLSIVNGYS